jgi:hypothetical protein
MRNEVCSVTVYCTKNERNIINVDGIYGQVIMLNEDLNSEFLESTQEGPYDGFRYPLRDKLLDILMKRVQ